jgi:hypothetical protein
MAHSGGAQVVGNISVYYAAYRLSQQGWNVMPTARNARGGVFRCGPLLLDVHEWMSRKQKRHIGHDGLEKISHPLRQFCPERRSHQRGTSVTAGVKKGILSK